MNFGPLTTTFTPPSSCTTPNFNHESFVLQGWYCDPRSGYLSADHACWPPFASTATASQSERFFGVGYYSPASICPAGYTVACSSTGGASATLTGGFSFQFPPEPGETALGCCPVGFGCTLVPRSIPDVTLVQVCTSVVTQGSFLEWGKCSVGHKPTLSAQHVPYVNSGRTIAAITKHNPIFQLKYRAATPTITAAPGNTATTPPQTTSPPSLSSSATAISPVSSSSGLSVGAEAGIGVGVGIFVLAVLALLVFCFFRRRQRDHSQASSPLTHVESQYMADAGDPKMAWPPPPAELGTSSTPSHTELPTTASSEGLHAELGVSTPKPVELPGSKDAPAPEAGRSTPFVQRWRFSELKDDKDNADE